MTAQRLWAEDYARWMEEMFQVKVLPGADEITTPFTNSLGDDIQIFAVAGADDSLELTDDGNTLNDLEMMGVNWHDAAIKRMVDSVLTQYTVKLRGDELVVQGTVSNFPSMQQRLLQAILRIDDISLTR